MVENSWVQLTQVAGEKLVSKIFNKDLSLKEIDREFTFKILDEMIKWDRRNIRPGFQVDEDGLNALFAIQDYFFYIIIKSKSEEIEKNLQVFFTELLSRVHNKHKNPYYEGFFNCLFQFIMFRKMLLTFGDDLWRVEWIERFQKVVNKFGIKA